MNEIKIVTKKRNEMIDITQDVQKVIDTDKIQEGVALVYVPHTTAGVTINEGADHSVKRDIIQTLNDLIPDTGSYHHSEGNSDAHIKASLVGSSVMVIIKGKRLVLGTWQHIFFYEGDGPRSRRVYINLMREKT